jgi:hypothetical protein
VEKLESFIHDFNAEILDRYNIHSSSYGGDYIGKIRKLELNFQSQYNLDRQKAVFLVQRISDDFLFYINRDADLVKFMQSPPLKREELNIAIDFFDEKYSRLVAPAISRAQLKDGRIQLFTYDQTEERLRPL